MSRPLIIGIGNRDRGDDGVGIRVAQLLEADLGQQVDVLLSQTDPSNLVQEWADRSLVIVIDAMHDPASAAGEVRCWDALADEIHIPALGSSSHVLGVEEAIALSRVLDTLPQCLQLYGVNALDFTGGQGLSAAVERAALTLVADIKEEIGEYEHA